MKDQTLTAVRAGVDALAKSKVKVNRETGEISGVAILSRGDATGHGFEIDETMLEQAVKGINKAGVSGLKMHMTHGHAESNPFADSKDGLLSLVAKTMPDARVEGGTVRGTIKLLEAAKHSPQGNMWDYLLSLAEESPESFGLSIVFSRAKFVDRLGQPPLGRIKEMRGVDFVGDPAGNSNGLLSRADDHTLLKETVMDAELLKELGLAADATAEQVKAKLDALKAEAKEAKTALAKSKEVDVEALKKQAADEAVKLEQKRASQIEALASSLGLDSAFASEMKNGGFSIEEVNAKAVEKLAKDRKGAGSGVVIVKETGDRKTMLKSALSDAVLLRAGVKVERPHDEAQKYTGLSIVDMARQYFDAAGVPDVYRLSRGQIVNLLGEREFRNAYPDVALSSSSDFSNILVDAMRKSLRQAYMDAPSQWQMFCRRETTPDFKTVYRTALSEAPTLTERKEGGEVKYVSLSDGKETYSLTEYTGGVVLTRRAILNDDLGAFGRIPMLQAVAAKRLEDDTAFGVLTANGTMADTGALFNSTAVTTAGGHANLITSGGGVPSVTTLAATETLMMKQKGPKNAAFLNLSAKYLIVPVALKWVAEQFVGSAVDPAKSNATVNPYNGKLTVIANPRLDANSATIWYLLADNSMIDTIEICFLESEQTPVLQQETDFDTDDVKFKVRHTLAGKAIDFRGMARNPGA